MARRGFVMPMVMLLAIIVGLMAGVVISRAAQRTGIVREQLEGYRESHRQRGVKEMVTAWLKYSADQDLAEMTGTDGTSGVGGEAFIVEVGRGSQIRVSFAPAQQTARIDPIGLSAEDASLARDVERSLLAKFGAMGLESRTRRVGPMQVDAMLAPDSVLLAIASGITGDEESGTRFVDELRREADGTRVDTGKVQEAGEQAGLDDEDTARLTALLGGSPSLWRVTATWVRPGTARAGQILRETYEGLIDMPNEPGASFGAQHPSELFLEWGRVETAEGYTQGIGG